jgi:hypothetical protein
MCFSKAGTIRRALTWVFALVPLTACAQSINVLWYAYAEPHSIYIQTIQKFADAAHSLPKSSRLRWKVTFFGPRSPAPVFANYNVLVVQSGEALDTVQHLAFLDPKKQQLVPDYSGILKNKAAIEAARGDRTFISGSDADEHAINGDTGNAPADPYGRKQRVTCHPAITGNSCWDGALGHLVNAVNWAGSGRGLGIVSLVAGEHPAARWWLDHNSFLRAELNGFVTIWGPGMRENNPVIPAAAEGFPLNSGLTSKGLGNWNNSFHAGFSHSIPGYAPIINSTRHPNTAVAIATAKFAGAGGPPIRSAP